MGLSLVKFFETRGMVIGVCKLLEPDVLQYCKISMKLAQFRSFTKFCRDFFELIHHAVATLNKPTTTASNVEACISAATHFGVSGGCVCDEGSDECLSAVKMNESIEESILSLLLPTPLLETKIQKASELSIGWFSPGINFEANKDAFGIQEDSCTAVTSS